MKVFVSGKSKALKEDFHERGTRQAAAGNVFQSGNVIRELACKFDWSAAGFELW
jgi:hypothetical protein